MKNPWEMTVAEFRFCPREEMLPLLKQVCIEFPLLDTDEIIRAQRKIEQTEATAAKHGITKHDLWFQTPQSTKKKQQIVDSYKKNRNALSALEQEQDHQLLLHRNCIKYAVKHGHIVPPHIVEEFNRGKG